MKKKINCPACGGHGFIAKFNDCSAWSECCEKCNGTGEIEVPFTIGDKIRSMSDEEIAAWLNAHVTDTVCDLICWNDCDAMATYDKTSDEVCKDLIKEKLAKEWY